MKNLQRYEVLDGLRGICALFVCILHARVYSHLYDVDFIRNAYLFVDFFFVLSGFVICISYSKKLNTKISIYNFTIKRIGRIWPLHVLMIMALVMIEIVKFFILTKSGVSSESGAFIGRFSIEALLANVFLVQSIGIFDYLTWNNPSWSISVEFFTYITFALSVYFISTDSKLKPLAIIISMISLSILFLLAPKNMDVTYDYGFIRCLSGFFIGVFICLWRDKFLNISFFKASFIELFIIILVVYFISEFGANKYSLLSPIVFGFSVWFFSYELGFISTILKNKWLQFLGMLSFTIYMTHSVLLTVIWRGNTLLTQETYIMSSSSSHGYNKIMHFGNPYLGDVFLIIYIAIVIGLSALIYKFYEEPYRVKFNQFANRKFK